MTAGLLEPARAHPFARYPAQNDLLALCVLREIEASGPLNGLEAANRLAPLTRLLRAAPPQYRLLHDLVDDGLLAVTPGRPPSYRITDAGRFEAELLAARCWPAISSALSQVGDRLAPERAQIFGFVTPWVDGERADRDPHRGADRDPQPDSDRDRDREPAREPERPPPLRVR